MLFLKNKISSYIQQKKTTLETSTSEKKSNLNDGFTAEDHKALDNIHESLDEILEISKRIGEATDSQTRQISRISGGVGNSLETIQTQKERLRKIHNRF